MSNLKNTLMTLDDELLEFLINVCQLALNDTNTITMVTSETEHSESTIMALAGLAVEISTSDGVKPSISTMAELNDSANELAALKAEFETG